MEHFLLLLLHIGVSLTFLYLPSLFIWHFLTFLIYVFTEAPPADVFSVLQGVHCSWLELNIPPSLFSQRLPLQPTLTKPYYLHPTHQYVKKCQLIILAVKFGLSKRLLSYADI